MTARLNPRYKASFAEHASPEAIDEYLRTARADRAKLDRHIAWLEALLERRAGEKAAGEWPHQAERG